MSGPKPRTAAFRASGFVARPPIDRKDAECAYGSPLPDAVWQEIVRSFDEFGEAVNVLSKGPRLNQNRNDARSYPLAKKKAAKSLDAALVGLSQMQNDDGMMRTLSIASMNHPGGATCSGELRASLEAARTALLRAAAIVSRADNPPVVGGTEEDARKALAGRILGALAAEGMDTCLTGWNEERFENGLAEADMTPAERLVSALEVHLAETQSAFVRWLRGAVG